MLKIRQKQKDIFRAPMRARIPDRILHELQARGVAAEREAASGDLVIKDARDFKTRLAFQPDGLPSKLTTPSGAEYRFEHDDADRLAAIVHPGGERVEMRLDERGNIRRLRRPGFYEYSLEYDDDNRFLSARYPNQKELRLSYGSTGRLAAITDRAGATTVFNRREDGRLLSITDPLGRTTIYQTDEEGGLEAVVYPDGTREKYSFDAGSNVVTILSREGGKIVQKLNEHQTITSVTWRDGSKVEYGLDDRGNLVSARNESDNVVHAFDGAGNPLSEQTSGGTVKYTYDPDGRLTSLVTPQNQKIEYEYDPDGRISTIKDWEGRRNGFIYAPSGTISEIRYGNGSVERHEYPQVGRLGRAYVLDKYGRTLCEQSYSYDESERLTQNTDSWGSRPQERSSRRFNYDAENRIRFEIDAQTGRPLASYTYDDKGNLTGHGGASIAVGLMDEPLSHGPDRIEYDRLGNMRRLPGDRGWIECRFSPDGSLREARLKEKVFRFTYDAFGRRLTKTDGSTTWRYGWAGGQLLWEEFQEQPDSQPARRDYLWLPGGATPLAFREGGRAYWIQADARGAVIRVYDSDGKAVWRAVYDSFGRATVEQAQVRQPWRLAGHYYDEETGLHYNRQRYYSPYLKSYLSRVPKLSGWEAANYSYARNDPWNRADPFGTIAPPLAASGIVAAGTVVGAAVALVTFDDSMPGAVQADTAGLGASIAGTFAPVDLFVGGTDGGALGAFAGCLIEQWRRGTEPTIRYALMAGVSEVVEIFLLGLGKIPRVKKLVKSVADGLFEKGKQASDKLAKEASEKVGKEAFEKALKKFKNVSDTSKAALEKFYKGEQGLSVKDFNIENKSLSQIDKEIAGSGGWKETGGPVKKAVSADGKWTKTVENITRDSKGNTVNPYTMVFYENADGGVIRLKPDGFPDAKPGLDHIKQPHGCKYVKIDSAGDTGFNNEAFKVEGDEAMPSLPNQLTLPAGLKEGSPEAEAFIKANWTNGTHVPLGK
ncbi:MAG TPA: RHS repeat-associated core domain-containing protein [Blastocatellia bacterium]|jgi:RHS repeat-associated protein|nr:RHS repeat-associated core domain-containing protein [Blastocatellia bacterium]